MTSTPTTHPLRGYLYVAGATLCWGISASLGRAAFTGRVFGGLKPIDPLILAQARTTVAFLLVAPILWMVRGRASVTLPRREMLQAFVLGVFGLAASNYAYYLAIQKTTVATAIILQYVAPVWVLLYMVLTRQQRATASRVSGVVLAVLGCVFAIGVFAGARRFPFLSIAAGSIKLNAVGVMAAEVAAIAFAFYSVYGRHLLQSYDRWPVLTNSLLGAAIFWILVNPPWKIVAAHYSAAQYGFMVLFAITSAAIPFSLYFAGLHHLDATRVIVTAALEPVFSVLIAAVFLGEIVSPVQVGGMAVVLSAILLVQRPEKGAEVIAVEPIE
ncbi:MAG TPA: DMT family transporter [Candidatus Koribacter sp.]